MLVLNDDGEAIKDARRLIFGLSYKANVDDDRGSRPIAAGRAGSRGQLQ